MNINPTLILICVLVAGAVIALVYGLYQIMGRKKALLADRVEAYTSIEEEAAIAAEAELHPTEPVPKIVGMLLGQSYMQKVEDNLMQADIAMRPTEYILLRLVLAAAGFMLGYFGTGYTHSGIILAVAGYILPAVFVRIHQTRRRNKFVSQLADALMLLTNSLRSGYGFLKGLELVAKEMNDPISKELNRMLREINLGSTVDQALQNLGRRINSPDLDIVISAYLVQKDVGGNLTEIMEKVAETIRERIRIQGDIRVLTAQGKLSGMIVGSLPVVLFLFFILKTPDYFAPMFGPPIFTLIGGLNVPAGVLLLIGGVIWQIIGAYIIYRIITIKV
jgi:tight adherence protein B